VDVQLPRIAFRSTVPWPDRSDKPGHAAALACITAALGLPAPIEEQLLERDAFDSIQTALTRLNYSPPPDPPSCQNPPNPFTLQDFEDVQNQLETEMLYGQGSPT
jgi:hypothetical protein